VPAADQALVELVKNAFDADATMCSVNIDDEGDHCTIVVKDDGAGMTEQQLRDRWLLIGSSAKVRQRRTTRFNRVAVGDKGLGRLAALRLGSKATLRTRLSTSPQAYEVVLDWREFATAKSVDAVDLEITVSRGKPPRGTTIILDGCPRFSDNSIRRIARSLVLVNDPFRGDSGFSVALTGSAAKRAGVKFSKRFFPLASYHIRAKHTGDGRVDITYLEQDKSPVRATLPDPYPTVPFQFDLWVFRLGASNDVQRSFSKPPLPITDIRAWLSQYGGVHVFSGPIRIAPYGERPVDWLDMNLMRVRSPEERPSTNNSIGRITIDNSKSLIVQTTDRIGFLENEPIDKLRQACRDALDWVAERRLKEAEKRRTSAKQSAPASLETVRAGAIRVLEQELDTTQLSAVSPVVSALNVLSLAAETARSDVVLYRSMATAGITASVFAHEIGQPLGLLARTLPAVARALAGNKGLLRTIHHVQNAAQQLEPYVKLPTRFAQTARRKARVLDLVRLAEDVIAAFDPLLSERSIDIAVDSGNGSLLVRSSPAMVDAIFGNLITNSVTALNRHAQRTKKIRVTLRRVGKFAKIRFEDNGGGIAGVDLADIWTPGISSTPGGTGFGLTIVRDTVIDLGGTVLANPKSRFGGARFDINLPVATP
jgi:signal transduction histidine kinase